MNQSEYKKFQDFQSSLWMFVDSEVHADEVFGNELYQRMSDASFEVFEKFKSIKNEKT